MTAPAACAGIASREVCDSIQDEQNEDFKRIWSRIHPDIGLVCLCGNHDLGNRPTPRSISRFRAAYGDEYLAFWCNGTYNIVVNNVLFVDPSGAKRVYRSQLKWLEETLAGCTADWLVVVGHRPVYSGAARENWPAETRFQHHMKRLMREHAVDLYIDGHDHTGINWCMACCGCICRTFF